MPGQKRKNPSETEAGPSKKPKGQKRKTPSKTEAGPSKKPKVSQDHSESEAMAVLTENNDRLQTLLQGNTIEIAAKAFASKLITAEEQQKCTHIQYTHIEKANFFMQYITGRVSVDDRAFTKLLDILEEELVYKDMATEMRTAYEQAKMQKVSDKIARIEAIAHDMERNDASKHLGDISTKMTSSTKLRLGVIGPTSSGKSTVLNAVIGREFLPASIKPQTAHLVCLKHDPKSPGVLFGTRGANKQKVATGVEDVREYIRKEDEKERSEGSHSYDSFEIHVPIPFIEGNKEIDLAIIDIPGSSEAGNPNIGERVWQAIGDLDGIILVLSADSAYETTAADLLVELKRKLPLLFNEGEKRVLVLVNKYDLLYDKYNNPSLDDERQSLAEKIKVSPEEIIFCSASLGLKAKEFKRNFPSITKAQFIEAQGDLLKLPSQKNETEDLSYPQGVDQLRVILERSSRISEVEELLKKACLNYRVISRRKAIDDTKDQVTELKRHAQTQIEAREKMKNRFLTIKAQLMGVFPDEFRIVFLGHLNSLVQTIISEIETGMVSQTVVLSGDKDDRDIVLQQIDAARNFLLSIAKSKLSAVFAQAVMEMKTNMTTLLGRTLDNLTRDLCSAGVVESSNIDISAETLVRPTTPSYQREAAIQEHQSISTASLYSHVSSRKVTKKRLVPRSEKVADGFLGLGSKRIHFTVSENYQATVYRANINDLTASFHTFATFCGEFLRERVMDVLRAETKSTACGAVAKMLELSGQANWSRWAKDGEGEMRACEEQIEEWTRKLQRLDEAENELGNL